MSKSKILIVEDEALIAIAIEEALTHLGFDVCGIVSHGNKLTFALEECAPDLILMDVMLPGNQDGIDLAKVINDVYQIPVVFLTASSNKAVFERAKETNSYGYIIKPFNDRDLKNTIELALFKSKAEQALTKSEEKYKSLFEFSMEEVFLIDPLSLSIIDLNSKAMDNLQYNREEALKLKLTDITPPGLVKKKFSIITNLIRGKETEFTVEHKRKDGTLYPVEIKAKLIKVDGKKIIQAYARDISTRIEAEMINNIIFNVSKKGNEIIQFEEYFSEIEKELSLLFDFDEFYVTTKKKDIIEFFNCYKSNLESGKNIDRVREYEFSKYLVNKGEVLILNEGMINQFAKQIGLEVGKEIGYWIGYPYRDNKGEVLGNFVFFSSTEKLDITTKQKELLDYLAEQVGLFVQKKISEKELKSSEAKNKAILNAIPDIMFRTTIDGKYLDYHISEKKDVLYPFNDELSPTMQDVLPEEIWRPELEISKEVVKTGVQQKIEYEYNGKYFECRIVKSGENEVLKIIRDVTKNKNLQHELEDSEKKYRTIFEKSPVGILSVSPKGLITSVNEYLLEMIGYNLEELVGKSMGVLLTKHVSKGKHDMWMKGFFRDPKVQHMVDDGREIHILHKDGRAVPVEINLSYIKDEIGTMGLALVQNISAKKEAERTQKSLLEKELQLKEIHHRVKNNMQVISSLLSLQSMSIDDDEIKAKYNESQNRISSMSLIHEKLYHTNNLNEIDFADYLKDLVPYIINSYPLSTVLEVKYDVMSLHLPLEQAIPTGLIINELISNSMKYAFKEKEEGTILVKCLENDGYAELYVSDNGVGIGDDKLNNKHLKSLGLKLIRSLTKQLGGEVVLQRGESGTECILKFFIVYE